MRSRRRRCYFIHRRPNYRASGGEKVADLLAWACERLLDVQISVTVRIFHLSVPRISRRSMIACIKICGPYPRVCIVACSAA